MSNTNRQQVAYNAQQFFDKMQLKPAIQTLLEYEHITRDFDLLSALVRAQYAVKDYDNCLKYANLCQHLRPTTDIILVMGHAYKRMGQYEQAIATYQRAIHLTKDPKKLAEIYDYIGHAHVFIFQFARAQEYYQLSLAQDPHYQSAWVHIVNGYNRAADYENSAKMGLEYNKTFARNPQIDINIALSYLSLGQYGQAWDYFDTRFETKYYSAFKRPFHCPIWQGQDLSDKKLFIQAEQGIGDQLIFSGFLHRLPKLGIIYYACDERFKNLMGQSLPHIKMVPEYYDKEHEGAQALGCDYYLPICSLPQALGIRDFDDHCNRPYLQYDRAQCDILKFNLQRKFGQKYFLGFAWWSLAAKGAGTDYRDRLIDPHLLVQKLLQQSPAGADNTILVSLQYNQAPNEEIQKLAKDYGYPIYCEPTINNRFDLDGLAALTMAMDQVVSIHQSIVHFCGALGQKCVVLLPVISNWQYQASKEYLVWYDSVRIHRKNHPDESWESALNRLNLGL